MYGFAIEEKTAAAVHTLYPTLKNVAGERIRAELAKLLCGAHCGPILREYAEVFAFLIPPLGPCIGFDQRTPYHRWDVYEHLVRSVETVAPTEVLRLAMLLHDVGKPACFTLDAQGIGHAYGHQKRSAELAAPVLDGLHPDNATRERVLLLVEYHDIDLAEDRRLLLRRLNRFGEEGLRQLIEVHRADAIAKGTVSPEEVNGWADGLISALDALLAERPCFSLKKLAVNGRDLLQAGVPKGPTLGQTLNTLLEQVMAGNLPNEREALLSAARALTNGTDSI